jgi:ribokinase
VRRLAVVGHVEWVDFIPVPHHPVPGEVLHAHASFTRAAGGGGVVAGVFADLGAQVDFFCALGDDVHGHAAAEQLRSRGVQLHVAWREQPTRRAVTLLEGHYERTIITIGERLDPLASDPLPWRRLEQAEGVYFTAGDAAALACARAAGVLVASPRARTALSHPGAELDALVYSGHDRDESDWAQRLESRARIVVQTEGAAGGRWWAVDGTEGRWSAEAPQGEVKDSYGCGDSFAAGFTFSLADGGSPAQAAAFGAECGARCLTRAGAP